MMRSKRQHTLVGIVILALLPQLNGGAVPPAVSDDSMALTAARDAQPGPLQAVETRAIAPPIDALTEHEQIQRALARKPYVDVLFWLVNNEFTVPEYQTDLDKKRAEIARIQDEVLSKLTPADFVPGPRFVVTNGLAGSVSKQGYAKLVTDSNVDQIFLDRKVYAALRESRPIIRADVVENSLGITGAGVTIALLDSGIDYTHPALGGCTTAQFLAGQCDKVVGGIDFVNLDDDPRDDNGHGTHVAGIAASTDPTFRGTAPDATLVAVKVLGADGSGWLRDVSLGLDWCVSNAPNLNIQIILIEIEDFRVYYSDTEYLNTYGVASYRHV